MPQVAVDHLGNAVATWLQIDPLAPELVDLWVARYLRQGGWQGASRRPLSTKRKVSQVAPSVGADATGRVFIAWLEDDELWLGLFE